MSGESSAYEHAAMAPLCRIGGEAVFLLVFPPLSRAARLQHLWLPERGSGLLCHRSLYWTHYDISR